MIVNGSYNLPLIYFVNEKEKYIYRPGEISMLTYLLVQQKSKRKCEKDVHVWQIECNDFYASGNDNKYHNIYKEKTYKNLKYQEKIKNI